MRYTLLVAFLLIVFASSYFVGRSEGTVPSEKPTEKHVASYPHKDFYIGLEQPNYEQQFTEPIFGGVTSHHLLTSEDMGAFFAEFSDQSVSTVVLIGPNHFSIRNPELSVSRRAFDTPWGSVEPNLEIIDILIEERVVAHEEEPFVYEHSISAVVPFIAHHLPDADLVPVVLRREADPLQLERLANALSALLPEDAIVIASVDFSHHLNRLGADFHDAASASAMQSFDFGRVLSLENCSPQSIYTLLRYLETKGAERMSSAHKNSTEYTGNLASEDVTSYFFTHFTEGERTPRSVATTLHFGDMLFDREVEVFMETGGDPFEYIRGVEGNFLRGVDAIVGNLEGPITEDSNCREKEVVFTFPKETARFLGQYLDGVTLANNHSLDCGEAGLENTKNALASQGVFHIGADLSPYVVEVGELSVAIIGTNELGRRVEDFAREVEVIRRLRNDHDHIVVHMHWGYEFASQPSQQQRHIAHMLVDAGADVIVGHHPHVIQPLEKYKDGLIFYSVGNFIFDQTQSGADQGIGIGLVHEEGRLGAHVFPFEIEGVQPRLLAYEHAKEFCRTFLAEVGGFVRDTCYIEIEI